MIDDASGLSFSEQEFLEDFHHTAVYGATDHQGIDRQAGTVPHGQVRDWFQRRAEKAGLVVETDDVGNIFATKEYRSDAPFILIGSHLDSQPLGGRFDGTYGVIAALHAVIAVDQAVARGDLAAVYNIAVVDWFNEEGARFSPSVMGSSVWAGLLDKREVLETEDAEGISVAQALESTGRRGQSRVDLPAAAYAEIHIEQGRRLEDSGHDIGLVEENWSAQKLRVRVQGEQSHAGSLLADRRDALLAASEVVLLAEQAAQGFSADQLITSVARLDVRPNSPSVIASDVELILDIRAAAPSDVEQAREKLLGEFRELETRRNVRIEVDDFILRPARSFTKAGVELAEAAAYAEGLRPMRLATLIGHDSVALNTVVPTVMLFIPSRNGVSHCEREYSSDEHMVNGVRVLARIAADLVEGAF